MYSRSNASRRILQFPWWRQRELSLPAFPIVTTPAAAQAAVVYGCVSMSTRPVPWGSGAVEIATPPVVISGSVGLAQAHPLTKTRQGENSLPPDLV